MKNRIITYFLLAVLFSSCAKMQNENERRASPNLLFIFADQYRRASLGFLEEDPVKTPNLDNLAFRGVFFSRAVSNHPLCSPYRGMLLTGQYPLSNGVISNCNSARTQYGNYLKKDDTCFSDVLVEQGYSAGYVGKWHLDGPTSTAKGEPVIWDSWCPPDHRHGFSFWYAYGTHNRHNQPYYWATNSAEDEPIMVNQWSPEHEADVLINYLQNNEQQRDWDKPFAMFWSINPPHTPFDQVPDKYKKQYGARDYREVLGRENVQFTSNIDVKGGDRGVERQIHLAPDYFAMVEGVDDQIGRVIAELKRLGLYENTVIVFSSDHGEMLGSHGLMHKNVWFKEAYEIPLIVHYPQEIAPKKEDLLISVPDYMPTVLGLLGLADYIPRAVEGKDYSGMFKGEEVVRPDKQLYFGANPDDPSGGKRGFRNEEYTFAVVKGKEGAKYHYLYHDKQDPYQLSNIWGENPELDQKMEQELEALLRQMNDPWL
ncbi:sulfatase family protein [Sunxiuqinia sp. sy24]|uniref:sulfatase family protein n=1 Tax=Sunxiuqinia sp. sy24 TaxID=3461495 RepID=UPI004045B85D